ncbi:MAG: xylulokinase [Thermoproteota archaeon]
MSYFLGVDVGTTSTKCVLFDKEGRVIASSRSEYEVSMPRPDFVEVDGEVYWKAFREALAKVLKESKSNSKDILGIGVSSQGETFIALGEDGKPLRRAVVWLDNRSKEEAKLIVDNFGVDDIYHITGQNDVIPTWTATKILWMRRNEPTVFRKVHKYLLLEDYMIYRLTGKFITDYSIACSSLLFEISRRRWWKEILDFIGISEDQLPELRPSGSFAGYVAQEAARETGLHTSTVVSTGAYDQAANAVGIGNIKPGIVTETTGGALAVVATTDSVILDPKRRMPCHHHAVQGKYFLQPWCQTAGAILKWYRDNFGLQEVEEARKIGADPYDLLTLEASKINPGSDGLILLPHFMGAASPEFNPGAKGVLFGLTLYHGKAHVIRSIMESIAYMLRRNIELLEDLGVKIQEVRSTGGAARSSLWNQIKSDVLQRPVLTVHTEETAALGVAMLASVATKAFSSLDEAIRFMVSIKNRFLPIEANRAIYDKQYRMYLELYKSLERFF